MNTSKYLNENFIWLGEDIFNLIKEMDLLIDKVFPHGVNLDDLNYYLWLEGECILDTLGIEREI